MSKDQFLKYLELQEQGYRVTKETAELVGYSGKEPQRLLRQDLRRNGYESSGDGYYIKKDSCDDNSNPNCGDRINGDNCDDNSNPNCGDKSNTLDDETIKKLLTLADNFDNIISNTSSNTFGDASNKITPCKSPTAQTIKVDHDVWQKFRKFAKASDYKQQDLLTTALELLMDSMNQ